MKKIFTFILISVLSAVTLLAQDPQDAPPQAFSYMAVIKKNQNATLNNSTICFKASILFGGTEGNVVYAEEHWPRTSNSGLIEVEIGRGAAVEGNFTAIDWSAGAYFLKTEADITGGTNYQLLAVAQLLSVPYALFAREAIKLTEQQVLSIEGNTISLSGGGGQVELPAPQEVSGQFWYWDNDNDGFGGNDKIIWIPENVQAPSGYVLQSDDCNDKDPTIYPGAPEICGDGIDQDCDGIDLECVLECPDGQVECYGKCADLLTDNQNCGECGVVCPSGYSCINGECVFQYSSTCFPVSEDPVLKLIRLLNEARLDSIFHLGIYPVAPHPLLNTAAQGHSDYMAQIGQLCHSCPDEPEPDFRNRILATGYSGVPYGEICAKTLKADPQAALNLWLNDKEHKDIICLRQFKHMGIGLAQGGNGGYYWTVVFGSADIEPYCSLVDIDNDGDGFTIADGDCDDNDATVYPGAPEICGDGIDNNCDGQVDENCVDCYINIVSPNSNLSLILDDIVTFQISLSLPAGPEGCRILITTSNPCLSVHSELIIPEGEQNGSVDVTANCIGNFSITFTSGIQTESVLITVN